MDVLRIFAIINARKRFQKRKHRISLLELRLKSKPFDLPDARFIKLFRVDKGNARNLIQQIEPYSRQNSISLEIQVLTTLNFYGHGSYQESIGSNSLFGLSQPSTSRAIDMVTEMINLYLVPVAIKFPCSVLDTAAKKSSFYTSYNMPKIIGVVDGTQVAILAPPELSDVSPGHLYINRKGYHSLNVLVIIDANMEVIYADARFPGSVHDSATWLLSPVRKLLKEQFTTVENQNSHIIGDSGFPLEPWLLTPLSNPVSGTPQCLYNSRFLTARNSIERAFGIIKGRFRCLLRHRVLHYAPEKAAKIMYAIFAIHNMYRIGLEHFIEEGNLEQAAPHDDIPRSEWHSAGIRVRDRYITSLT